MRHGILIVGHGSRDQAGNGQFLALAESLTAITSLPLEPSFLDHAHPTIAEGFRKLVERGVQHIGVVPLFLFAAGHAKQDVPLQLQAAAAQHPGVTVAYGRPLGIEPRLVEVAGALLAEAEAEAEVAITREQTAILLIGRGSSDPEATADLLAVGRLLEEATGYGAVLCAFCDVASPRVEEGLAESVRRGFRRVILLPYFLFQGVLMTRLQQQLAGWRERTQSVSFLFAGARGLGGSPHLPRLVMERAEEAFLSWKG